MRTNSSAPPSSVVQSAVDEEGMHVDRKPTGECETGLLQAETLGDLNGPGFQGEGLTAQGKDRVGSFVQQLAHGPIALFGDPASPIELARLMASGHKAKVGPGIA